MGPVVCLTLAVVLIVGVLLVPFGFTGYRSFFSNGLNPVYVGFANYKTIFHDPILVKSLINTLMWVVGSLVLPVGVGLGIAVMTNQLKWGKAARLAIVLPYALSGTAVAVVGGFMLRSDGAINQMLGAFGLGGLQHQWLLTWPSNTICAILVSVWQATGVAVVLYMVGLQGIPAETLEAAALDGAAGLKRFRYIIIPQLRPVTAVVVGITLANALRAFDVTWVLTNGGPARTSETLALSMYSETFLAERPGVGAAIAILLTAIVLASSWAYLRKQTGDAHE
ncbi:permease [Nocardioides baekrokdamisoli]|uniref:Permease n=1 Tax=Nocardioides baekrokdamisoli TaxID=1804624 RepID=A0A3G9IGS7_9ACTN|nr:permease [Nocardioides baekrokdamisoli]